MKGREKRDLGFRGRGLKSEARVPLTPYPDAAMEATLRARQAAIVLAAYPTDIDALDCAMGLVAKARRWAYQLEAAA